ncbi:hypothetical protein K493DRAFT_391916 [Basidiobolus meristosporus CBS 931.73]|uniref:Uncharacterized protein n=1 Tax=Basidiobolus meristosporus CBS 931.73 TaxID=1314790 RepID=A0A1Y1WXA6_9FUNG|nr:hypothetical protein K493DRAFT_391916 [Basidiobolus meristosporus CBS 931.73]|eukprot:ORX78181.1 hypothetical protein K493DRAFT_391916 [Basidiobolus meristosporus CBS 931.73]
MSILWPNTKRYISEFMSARFAALSLRRDVLKEVGRSKFNVITRESSPITIDSSSRKDPSRKTDTSPEEFGGLSFSLHPAFHDVIKKVPDAILSSPKAKGLTPVRSLVLYKPPQWLPPIQEFQEEESEASVIAPKNSSVDLMETEHEDATSNEMMDF